MNVIRISIFRMCSLCVFTHIVEVYYDEDEKMLIKHNTEKIFLKWRARTRVIYSTCLLVLLNQNEWKHTHTTALHANCSVKIHAEDETRRAE